MLPQAEVDASFMALSRQYRKLVEDVVAKTNAEGHELVLNNTRVFLAYRSGIKPSWLTSLDEGRMIDSAEGNRGTLTVWKYVPSSPMGRTPHRAR